jgi:adenosylcobinamide-GDP ribazoletransferase
MKKLIEMIKIGLSFFTIVPAGKRVEWTERKVAGTLLFLPVLGGVLALLLSGVIKGEELFSPLVFSLLLLFIPIIITGGLHLDGWMDVSDAYFSHQNREKKLAILSDPNVGAFAVISLLVLLSFRFMAIYELVRVEEVSFLLLVMILSGARLSSAFLLMYTKSAKESGLAFYFQSGITAPIKRGFWIEVLLFFGFCAFVSPLLCFVLGGALLLYTFCARIFFQRQFGGITGDSIGATIEGGETCLWIIMWLFQLFVMA